MGRTAATDVSVGAAKKACYQFRIKALGLELVRVYFRLSGSLGITIGEVQGGYPTSAAVQQVQSICVHWNGNSHSHGVPMGMGVVLGY